MKKYLLAGVLVIIALGAFFFYDDIFPSLPLVGHTGDQPREIWAEEIGAGTISNAAEREGILVVAGKNQGFFLSALNYQGQEEWRKKSQREGDLALGRDYWCAVEGERGRVEIFDYQGRGAGQLQIPADFKKVWIGPGGEIISLHSFYPEGEDLEDLYGERLQITSREGKVLFDEKFTGKGILDVRIIPGQEVLLLNVMEVYPQAKSNMIFMSLEGEIIESLTSSEMFMAPLLCPLEEKIVLATSREFYLYSPGGEKQFSRLMDFEMEDMLITGEGEILLVTSPPSTLSRTFLKGVNHEGEVTWEKGISGNYQDSLGRKEGGIYLLTDQHLHLFSPGGESHQYFSVRKEEEVYLLSGEAFLTYDGQNLKAYHWPLPPLEKVRAP